MTVEEAQDIANVLKAGKLPAAAHIIQSEVVGPSLGQKAIDSSMSSFALEVLLVLVWMIFYYGKAGALSFFDMMGKDVQFFWKDIAQQIIEHSKEWQENERSCCVLSEKERTRLEQLRLASYSNKP